MAKNLNCGAFRLSIEWARIEPKEGEFSYSEIEHYREVLMSLKERNLKVVLTLWHFTNPMWLVHEGGWSKKKSIDYFARYVEFVVRELGDLVDFWVTINEPTVHILNGYFKGNFPPNKHNLFLAVKTFLNLVKAHRKAYDVIRKYYLKANIGFTHLGDNFEPARAWFFPEVFLAWFFNFLGNNLFLIMVHGHTDYIGLDYYFHNRVVWYPPFIKNINKEVSDRGWEIYPKGIYNILKALRRFKRPIYIMENGIADAADTKRAKFIADHLRYVHKAIEEGEDIRGYFYWSLMDNFEWEEGFTKKFGLYAVDRETFARTPRPSAAVYAEICKNNGISSIKN